MRECSNVSKPVFAGRSFCIALRDEVLPDLVTMNRVLEPLVAPLLRLAARGHWLREHRPVQEFATMLHHLEPGRSWRGMNFQVLPIRPITTGMHDFSFGGMSRG